MSNELTSLTPPLLQAECLGFAYPGFQLLADLSFAIHPGLSWVHGGDGRGKTTLLRLLAGQLQPGTGTIHRRAAPVFLQHPADPGHDTTLASAWLTALQARHPSWNTALAQTLTEAFVLADHLAKPLFMLSTGSRRKLGLVAAAACGAPLTLLDSPFAALDAPSVRVLTQLLTEAAAGRERAWVVADGQLPQGLAGVALAARIDLGD